MKPSIGRIVIYRSRTGFEVPALVTATQDTLEPKGLKLYEESGGMRGVPPLDSDGHLHLTVMTPGIPGVYPEASSMPSTPMGGTFQEWNIPYAGHAGDLLPGAEVEVIRAPAPGTWHWPERV